MSSNPALTRVVRRETHSPRTVAMFVAVILLIVALAYVGTELVLALASLPAILVTPAAALAWIIHLPSVAGGGFATAAAVILALLGLLFVVLAVTPGRLSKHEMRWDRRAVVVDNAVIAASLAQRISDETGLSRDSVTVGVAHRAVDVVVRPGWGVPLDDADVRIPAEDELDTYQLARPLRLRVRIDRPRERGAEE